MSKKGLRYVAFAKLKADGTYENGKHLSPAAAFNANANASDVKDYGDDRTVELNNDDDEMYVYLLGHTQTTGENGEIISNADDVAPYVGAAAVGKSGSKWVAKVYNKCQFAEPNDENSTKEETVNFNHISLEGDILIPEDGNWKRRKSFDTFAAAKTYVDTLFNVTGETGET